ncbi:MAG: tetratricopeptide repeat protein [Flavobacterium sp.]|nr:tetratricopeptide repeat protein [Flavobacterium sp.]
MSSFKIHLDESWWIFNFSILPMILLVITLSSIASCVKRESEAEDSLKQLYTEANSLQLSSTRKLSILLKAEQIILNMSDSLKSRELFTVADYYWDLGKYDRYYSVIHKALNHSLLQKDTLSVSKSYLYIGDYYNEVFIMDSAFYYYNKAERFAYLIESNLLLRNVKLRKGQVQYSIGDYFGAENTAFEILKLHKGMDYKSSAAGAYNLLGNVYCDLRDYDAAVESHYAALKIYSLKSNENVRQFRPISYFNLGLVYQEQRKFAVAKNYYELTLKSGGLQETNPSLYANAIGNLGYCIFKLGDRNFPALIEESLRINKSLNFQQRVTNNLLQFSEYYLLIGKDDLAFSYALEAYNTSLLTIDFKNQLHPLKQLIFADPKNASAYAQRYIELSDSLQLAERKARNKFARIEYETDELALENDQVEKEKRISLISATAIILLMTLLFVIYRHKMKQREFFFKQNQQETNEEIYRLLLVHQNKVHEGRQYEKHRISRDLHDGIMNRLASTRLNLFALTQANDPKTIQNCLPFIEDLKVIENEVRDIAHDLSKDITLGHDSYTIIIENLINQQKVISNTDFHLSIDNEINWDLLESNYKINIYRILQECLQNISIHAHAHNVYVNFSTARDQLIVEVIDDGVGFSVKRTKAGIGLKNILSRAAQIGATIDFESDIGAGTKIKLVLSF